MCEHCFENSEIANELYQLNAELLTENQRLREENEKLRGVLKNGITGIRQTIELVRQNLYSNVDNSRIDSDCIGFVSDK